MTLKTIVQNHRIELDLPLDIPDGTEVEIRIRESEVANDEEMTPEEIARILAVMRTLEPLEFSDEEREAIRSWREKNKQYTIENMNRDIENLFP